VHYSADPTPGKHTIGAGLYYNSLFLWEDSSWAPRNKRHLKSEEYIPSDEEALKSVAMAAYKMILDGAGSCYYAMLTGNQHLRLQDQLNAATGWNKSLDDYLEIGKRVQTARQQFNIREGIDPKTFIMKKRMRGTPPLNAGPLKGKSVKIDEMVSLHWKHFGWDPLTGKPLAKTLKNMGLALEEGDK
jgi:aldehyde:ferredoxin oxidoreductase